ncbi:hypothetical protein [Bacillus sp. T33-2]|uniref:hypothetical protein n=1 Tax=Bacillus sp. T33-2 TaxID=2054168 RepID=UPI000C78522E|nr:hypothetical protein [Bacillus sp. T33-2]PLR99645.1 hypothetical protein CVD19_00875 [Bacillus sp. T33-2]
MMDIKEFYILGLPIQTEIGVCHFLKVKEYPDYFMDLQIIGLSKQHFINKYAEMNKRQKDPLVEEFIEELKIVDLYQIVVNIPEVSQAYFSVLSKVFDDGDIVEKITPENFSYYRNLVMTMNFIKEEKINPNPEIQRAIERSRRLKQQDSEGLEFSDLVSSVVGFNGLSYQDINEFTVYQLYMTYYRIAQIKNYDTSTLFATVSSEKIKIESWSKHINLFEDEKHFISEQEFKKKTGSVFNG